MRTKAQNEQRVELLRWLEKSIADGKFQVSDKNSEKECIMICSRVEDFDPKSNALWDIEANKSYPREVTCKGCLEQMVMSNNAYRIYEENGCRQEVICSKCFFSCLGELSKK